MTELKTRAPYGRQARPEGRTPERERAGYQGETYYGEPAIKASHYGWTIVTYFFVGGIAGGAQLLASIADLVGGERDRSIVRWGRYLALAGTLFSPALLIADLHTPRRWYNMLRICRRTSPMSIGSWTLFTFGGVSTLMALGQAAEDLGPRSPGARRAWTLTRVFSLPAAVLGALMSCYTGVLLAATSVPLWASAPRVLPALFGASALSTATAALSLGLEATGAPPSARRRLGWLALIASGVELALIFASGRIWRHNGLATPLEQQPLATLHRLGATGLGTVVPLALHLGQTFAGRHSPVVSNLADLATLGGGYLLRTTLVFGGNASARRPEDYFRFTQPGPRAEGQGR